jgi:hypothetical protein
MPIEETIRELTELKKEISSLRLRIKDLNSEVKMKNETIKDYLCKKNEPGVKHNGKAYYLKEGIKRNPKKKLESEIDSLRILEDAGIKNPEKILEKILEARRGGPEPISKLIVEKIKNNK